MPDQFADIKNALQQDSGPPPIDASLAGNTSDGVSELDSLTNTGANTSNTSNGITSSSTGNDSSDGQEIVVTDSRNRQDYRIRLSAPRGQKEQEQIYGINDRTNNILSPLWATEGLLFPYTPTIQVSQDTSWLTADLEQTNYDILSFQKSSSASISLTGKFTVQNQREGEYLLAAIHFLRTVSKAYFGAADIEQFIGPATGTGSQQTPDEHSAQQVSSSQQDGKSGLPPPVLLFSGYGTMMFNDIRVVVKSHSWSYDENADLIKINLPNGETVWLPPLMTINMTLGIQQNTNRIRDKFNLDQFRTGELLKTRGWF